MRDDEPHQNNIEEHEAGDKDVDGPFSLLESNGYGKREGIQ